MTLLRNCVQMFISRSSALASEPEAKGGEKDGQASLAAAAGETDPGARN